MLLRRLSKLTLFFLPVLFGLAFSCSPQFGDGIYAQMETSRGIIIIQLDYQKAPLAVANFIGLSEGTITYKNRKAANFYNGLKFFQKKDQPFILAGCPFNNGSGGPGYTFPDEHATDLKHDSAGILGMLGESYIAQSPERAGAAIKVPDSNGSIFYLTRQAKPDMDGKYSIFGKVIFGLDVLEKLDDSDKINKITIKRIGEAAAAFQYTNEEFQNMVHEAYMASTKDFKPDQDGLYAEIVTSKGKITLKLEYEKAPIAVANFVGLTEGSIDFKNRPGKHFYDGLTFHRVVDDFVIQGGCPYGNGKGGPGYVFPNETDSGLKHDAPGILAMANSGPDTNGSQFYITLAAIPYLDGGYTVFGKVVSGMDVVRRIRTNDIIDHVQILRVGPAAQNYRVESKAFFAQINAYIEAKEQKITAIINAKYPGTKKDDSGIRFKILKPGSGKESPTLESTVTVHYEGFLLDGSKFDSSYDRKEPASFQLKQVIQGWQIEVARMKKGEKRLIIIPPSLGYGNKDIEKIPANSYLVFIVELIDFK